MASDPPRPRRRAWRSLPLAVLAGAILLCFVGGAAASLFQLFARSPEARNSWLLLCGAPCGLVIVGLVIIINLYIRFGRPMEELFAAINAVGEGNLAARVPENRSDMFSDLSKRFNKMVAELERAEQQRRNLTADIAHELRTPLHLIQGNLEGILDGIYEPTAEHINNTLDETRLLTRLANDLQMLSLAETGHLPLHPRPFAAADLLADLTTSFGAQATAQGLALVTRAGPDVPLTADYDRLNQVLSNLIANALRYTPTGGQVELAAEPLAEPPGAVRLTVRDTGAGIAPEDLPFIFDRLWRGDKSRSDRVHTGLGLAIARQLVQAHGGQIEAQSTLGQGTTFTIDLPPSSAPPAAV